MIKDFNINFINFDKKKFASFFYIKIFLLFKNNYIIFYKINLNFKNINLKFYYSNTFNKN